MNASISKGPNRPGKLINIILILTGLSFILILPLKLQGDYSHNTNNLEEPSLWIPEEFYTLPALQAEWKVALCRTANCSGSGDSECFIECRNSTKLLPEYVALQERHKDMAYVFAKNCRNANLTPCPMILAFPWFTQFVWGIIIGDHPEDCGLSNCYTHVMVPGLDNNYTKLRLVSDSLINSIVLQTPNLTYSQTGTIDTATIDGNPYWAVSFSSVPLDTTLHLIVNADTLKLWLF